MTQTRTRLQRDPDFDDEVDTDIEEEVLKTLVVKDYSLAEANIPPDRTSVTRALFITVTRALLDLLRF